MQRLLVTQGISSAGDGPRNPGKFRHYNTRPTQKAVRHRNTWFGTEMHGSTQKNIMHQLPLPLLNTALLYEIFSNFIQIVCFYEPIEKWKRKYIGN